VNDRVRAVDHIHPWTGLFGRPRRMLELTAWPALGTRMGGVVGGTACEDDSPVSTPDDGVAERPPDEPGASTHDDTHVPRMPDVASPLPAFTRDPRLPG
jgi:hypothetical protein